MKMLIVAATEMEIMPFRTFLAEQEHQMISKNVDILITGVGMLATAYEVLKKINSEKYDFALQAGVCGSFDDSIVLGSLVQVASDRYGDLGAEDHEDFIDIFDLGLLEVYSPPFIGKLLVSESCNFEMIHELPKVSAITVNTVSGREGTIANRKKLYQARVESMEGVAFQYVCLREGLHFVQIRSVSNYVIPRDKRTWKMGLAIKNLNEWLCRFVKNTCID